MQLAIRNQFIYGDFTYRNPLPSGHRRSWRQGPSRHSSLSGFAWQKPMLAAAAATEVASAAAAEAEAEAVAAAAATRFLVKCSGRQRMPHCQGGVLTTNECQACRM
jgi:hypothetical protein